MNRTLILASQSPRRRELMTKYRHPFKVISAQIEETLDMSLGLEKAMEDLAERKARHVLEKCPDAIVIGADTIVVLEGEILGKPVDEEAAKNMLRKLSGTTHQVLTGVAIISQEQVETFCDCSEVEFYPLNELEINEYVATKEPLDKAGAYGIQGEGYFLVKEIRGDYYSIMGLPIARVVRSLRNFE